MVIPSSRFLEYHGIIGYLLVHVVLRCMQASVFPLVVSGVVAGEEYGLETICNNIEYSKNSMAPLCKKDLHSVRFLSPLHQQVVQGNNSLDEFDFYPWSFLVRPRWQEDSIDYVSSRSCETEQDAMTIVRIADTENRRLKHQQIRVSQLTDHIMNEDHNNIDNTSPLKVRRRKPQSELDMVAAGARKFHGCCLDSIPKENKTKEWTIPNNTSSTGQDTASILAWKDSDDAKRCKEIGQDAFADISQHLATIMNTANGQPDEKNQILRKVVAVWGNPSILAHLLLIFGCTEIDAYDEFLGCYIKIHNLDLNINVWQRSVDADVDPEAWTCKTCTIHQHPRTYASYVVAGQTNYTMVRPDCPTPTEMVSPLPTMEELEMEMPITGKSLIDTPGTRFHMNGEGVVWETQEVVLLTQGQSVVFSPLWYHRVPPPAVDATHAAVTFIAKFRGERSIGNINRRKKINYLMIPDDIAPENTEKLICFRLLDLYGALVHPELNVQLGLGLFPCTDDTMHGGDDANDFNIQVGGALHNTHNDKASTDASESDEDEEL